MSDFDDWLTSQGKSRETASDLDEIQWLRLERQGLRSCLCWMPVSERLPEKNEGVLLSDGNWVTYGWLVNDNEWKAPSLIRGTWIYSHQQWEAMTGHVELSRFSHWIKMPEPPEVK